MWSRLVRSRECGSCHGRGRDSGHSHAYRPDRSMYSGCNVGSFATSMTAITVASGSVDHLELFLSDGEVDKVWSGCRRRLWSESRSPESSSDRSISPDFLRFFPAIDNAGADRSWSGFVSGTGGVFSTCEIDWRSP